jgi:hypothetical protein
MPEEEEEEEMMKRKRKTGAPWFRYLVARRSSQKSGVRFHVGPCEISSG